MTEGIMRRVLSALLSLGGVAALLRGASQGFLGRFAGVIGSAAMLAIALAVWREQEWGWGAAFVLGLCWLWATVALRVQDILQPGGFVMWLAWSVGVIVLSVRGRAVDG